ncbi:MAG: response regulator [Thermodesulfobacteriota bacterium]|nr:response regulator [Thermodesulfobacteriota bacterium]
MENREIKVLLVDDRDENLVALEALMEDLDLNIFKARSGNEALGLMLSHEFAIVLLDVQMPEMDGFETAELMRKSEKTKNIPIIFVTAISKEQQHIFKGYDKGAVDYLCKPIESHILMSKVRIFIDLYRKKKGLEKTTNELKITVQELENSNQKIKEKQQELQEKNIQLHEAVLKAEQMAHEANVANRAKSDFLANISHELRTPLNGIVGFAELLFNTKLTEEQTRYVSVINFSSENLLSLIKDLLDYSKIESRQIDIDSINFDLRVLVEDVVYNITPIAQKKGIETICIVEKDMHYMLRGDPGRLRQILINLIGNAVKFTDQGDVTVQVSKAHSGKDKTQIEGDEDNSTVEVLFSVKDTGIGIPEDKLEAIFEKFTQADGSITRTYGGTGLGLSISKQLVEIMGGQIDVESTPGKGSRFWFTLPFEKKEIIEKTPLSEQPYDLENTRIMIVDDNATNREVLSETLKLIGICPKICESGMEALKEMRALAQEGKPYELILVDIQMPQMDGMSLIRSIKGDPGIADSRIIVLTSVGDLGHSRYIKKLGCDGYLTKPISQHVLFDTIKEVLSREKQGLESDDTTLVTMHSIKEKKYRDIRILIAEDNEINLELVVNILKKEGYTTYTAKDGERAINAYERMPFDLILMDLQMPVIDGFEATKKIREIEKSSGKHIPIIALTAQASGGDREECLNAGMDGYLSKPIKPILMFEEIERLIKGGDISGQAEEKAEVAEENPEGDILKDKKEGRLPIDINEALERMMDDRELLYELLLEFLSLLPEHMKSIRDALMQKDAEAIHKKAHNLKGSAANLSAKRIAEVAKRLEQIGRSEDLSEAAQTLSDLEEECEHLKDYICQMDIPIDQLSLN